MCRHMLLEQVTSFCSFLFVCCFAIGDVVPVIAICMNTPGMVVETLYFVLLLLLLLLFLLLL